MREKHKSSIHHEPVNKEAFKMLATEIGLLAACRKVGLPIPTAKAWSRRGNWKLPRRHGGRPPKRFEVSSKYPVADALVETHKDLEAKTKTGLATAAAKAADHVQSLDGASTFGQSNKLRDLAASAARIFGWDKGPQTNVQVNTLKVTQEQLAEIRALRDTGELP